MVLRCHARNDSTQTGGCRAHGQHGRRVAPLETAKRLSGEMDRAGAEGNGSEVAVETLELAHEGLLPQ